MTDERRAVKIALIQQRMTFADLAKATNLSPKTIDNVLAGRGSDKSRQAISNMLQLEIFPGIKPRPAFTFPAGTEMESPTVKGAKADAALLGDRVTRRGKIVTFVKDTQFVRLDVGPDDKLSERRAAKRTRTQKQPASKSAPAS